MTIAFLDTETTSLDPDREIWEVAVILGAPTGTESTLTWQWFVDVTLDRANAKSLDIGGFYERHPMGRYLSGRDDKEPTLGSESYLTRHDTARLLARLTHDVHLVGALPNFDAESMDRLLRNWFQLPSWHYHLIDIEAMAFGFLQGRLHEAQQRGDDERAVALRAALPELPWNSDDLSRACGVEPPSDEDRHTALGDASWVQRWHRALTGGAS